jgi:hypothetical protein
MRSARPLIQAVTMPTKCARDILTRQVRHDGGTRRNTGRSRVARGSSGGTLASRLSKSFGRTLSNSLLRRN